MKYRQFNSLDWKSSVLGLGTARLPLPDEAATVDIIRYAIDCGINYLDLGYPFDEERHRRLAGVIGKALRGGYRDKVKISLTLPTHRIHSSVDFDRLLSQQLAWLHADHVSFCLFGRLNRDNWPVLKKAAALDWAAASIANGRIEKIGFSFYDHFQVLKSILAAYDRWTLCQFQFSYMDIDHNPGISGIRYAEEKGLAVAVTESLKGGRLTKGPPDPVARIWGENRGSGRLAEWGLRFVWNHPEVSTVVCDMSSFGEVAENAAIARRAKPDSLNVQEEVLIGRVRDAYRKLRRIPCSWCRPCMPCPEGIDIPRIFELYNDAFIYEDVESARSLYRRELHHAERCNQCGVCEKRCAGKLKIIDRLEEACRLLAGAE